MEWISVNERLPPLPPRECLGHRYIACWDSALSETKLVDAVIYTYYGVWHIENIRDWTIDPTHWMELPKPPKQ